MKISVQVKPKKKNVYVEQISPDYYIVSVNEPPVEGKANNAVIKALAGYFSVPKSSISLVSGHAAKMKIFEVPDSLKNFETLPKQKDLFN